MLIYFFRRLADALPQNYCFDNTTRVNESTNNEEHVTSSADHDEHVINEDQKHEPNLSNATKPVCKFDQFIYF